MTLPTSRNQSDAAAVGGNVDVLVRVGSVELQGVDAILAFDNVAAVARIPDEPVVAAPQKSDVVAAPADHIIVSIAADEGVCALTAGDGVVARAAVDREPDRSGAERGSIDFVVAAESVDDEPVVGALGAVNRHLSGQSC